MTAQQLDRVFFQRRKHYLLGSHSVDEQEAIGPLPGEAGFSIGSLFERDYANTWSPALLRPDTRGIRTRENKYSVL